MKNSVAFLILALSVVSFCFSSKEKGIRGTYHLGAKDSPSYYDYQIQILRNNKFSINHTQWVYSSEQITKTQGNWELMGDSLILTPIKKSFWHSKVKKKEWKCGEFEECNQQIFIRNGNKITKTDNTNMVYTKN